MKKKQGRQKIEIKKIDNPSNRQVTFSKRRAGIFKKAAELCILSGAEMAILVQSFGRSVFSFGHPTADVVVNRFLSGSAAANGNEQQPVPTSLERDLFNKNYNDSCKDLETERGRKEAIENEKKTVGSGGESRWWEEPFDALDMSQLEEYGAALEELTKNVTMRANDLMLLQNSNGRMVSFFNNTRGMEDESALVQDQKIGHDPQL